MKNLNIKLFTLSVFTASGINIFYVISNIPPDGRWSFQVPFTSLFILFYLAVSVVINNIFIKNLKNRNFIPLLNIFISLLFLLSAREVEIAFQNNGLLYIKYIAISSYIVIFGLGIILSIVLSIFLEKFKYSVEK